MSTWNEVAVEAETPEIAAEVAYKLIAIAGDGELFGSQFGFESKYEAEDVISAIFTLTDEDPSLTVIHSESWDDDGAGRATTFYREGKAVASHHATDVPKFFLRDLKALTTAVGAKDSEAIARAAVQMVAAFREVRLID